MFDYLIIGGGLVGLMMARELAPSGASIAIVDRNKPGHEASWAAGGILSPLFPWDYDDSINLLSRWSQLAYPQLAKQLTDETGIDPEYQVSGMLVTRTNGLDQAIDWCLQKGIMSRPLPCSDFRSRFPELTLNADKALLLEHIAHIRPPRLIKALVESLKRSGIHFLDDQTVAHIDNEANRVTGITTQTGERYQAGQYVLCGGAWTRELWPRHEQTVDIRPVKGQIILFPDCGITLNCMYMHDYRYLIQRRDGRILVGSTSEHSGYDKRTTEKAKEELVEFAHASCPALANVAVEHHWAGLRPAAPGSIPYIDRHPTLSNLSINSGHYRNGIVLAPGSAHLLADRLLNRSPIMPANAFSIDADRPQ